MIISKNLFLPGGLELGLDLLDYRLGLGIAVGRSVPHGSEKDDSDYADDDCNLEH